MDRALRKIALLVAALAFCATRVSQAADTNYGLAPLNVAPDTYVFVGAKEDFSPKNGGNIVNTGFIATDAGIVVIDTGPSLRYGTEMRTIIERTTGKPVVMVVNTHHHPDHFLGNQAFRDVPVRAPSLVREGIEREGAVFTDNLYRLSGEWMRGTEPLAPTADLTPGIMNLGGHKLEFMVLSGHTPADLVVLDHTTGVLFAGDLVFSNRAPTTPHADFDRWLAALDHLQQLPFRVLIPGHGDVVEGRRAIEQTRDYLSWLQVTLRLAAEQGLDMAEAMALPIPERFQDLELVRSEFQRSVAHFYQGLERSALAGH